MPKKPSKSGNPGKPPPPPPPPRFDGPLPPPPAGLQGQLPATTYEPHRPPPPPPNMMSRQYSDLGSASASGSGGQANASLMQGPEKRKFRPQHGKEVCETWMFRIVSLDFDMYSKILPAAHAEFQALAKKNSHWQIWNMFTSARNKVTDKKQLWWKVKPWFAIGDVAFHTDLTEYRWKVPYIYWNDAMIDFHRYAVRVEQEVLNNATDNTKYDRMPDGSEKKGEHLRSGRYSDKSIKAITGAITEKFKADFKDDERKAMAIMIMLAQGFWGNPTNPRGVTYHGTTQYQIETPEFKDGSTDKNQGNRVESDGKSFKNARELL